MPQPRKGSLSPSKLTTPKLPFIRSNPEPEKFEPKISVPYPLPIMKSQQSIKNP